EDLRFSATFAWTGSHLLEWGGFAADGGGRQSDGVRYDPVTDRWEDLPPSPLHGRYLASGVWTQGRLLVWGGESSESSSLLADGALYDAAASTWRMVAASPLSARALPDLVAVGGSVLVWGGYTRLGGSDPQLAADGALYDLAGDRWLALPALPIGAASDAVWAGGRVPVWGSERGARGAAWIPPAGLGPSGRPPRHRAR